MAEALSDADRAAVLGALMVAEDSSLCRLPMPLTQVLVVAMGRQGGREIGYGSDADVLVCAPARCRACRESSEEAATSRPRPLCKR